MVLAVFIKRLECGISQCHTFSSQYAVSQVFNEEVGTSEGPGEEKLNMVGTLIARLPKLSLSTTNHNS